ncbi:Uncharacterised protein [uncultured Clostridium sp.]|nr:Uncharacterised protein [uncultured Clostridium sp.]
MRNDKNIKDVILMIIAGIILISIIYGFIFFFGGSILLLFGLKYDSFWSLAKFFGVLLILSIPIDFIVVCFLKVLKEIKGLTDIQHNILYFILGIPLTMIIIGMSEYLIKGVSCSMLTAFIFSIITYLFNLFLDKKISEE